jgi:hypothetical protein
MYDNQMMGFNSQFTVNVQQQQSSSFLKNEHTNQEVRVTAGASAAPGEKNNEQKQDLRGFSLTSKF